MAVLAHPDDESLGIGGTLARYASEGVETYLVTATRGENGRHGRNRSVRRSNWATREGGVAGRERGAWG